MVHLYLIYLIFLLLIKDGEFHVDLPKKKWFP